jgi:plasmid stabilization system protein ParE
VDFQVRISKAALADFEEILAYSWERIGNAILNYINLLKSFPYIPGILQLVHTPLLIYCRVHEAPDYVEILQFRHASRKPAP